MAEVKVTIMNGTVYKDTLISAHEMALEYHRRYLIHDLAFLSEADPIKRVWRVMLRQNNRRRAREYENG